MTVTPEQASLTGRVAVVTGGAQGIGEATALAFAVFGADVAVCDRDKEGLEAAGRWRLATVERSSAGGIVQRVAIVGSGGSGKSVLARELASRLGITVTHLDVLFWKPGWSETPQDEWRKIQAGLVAEDSWIIDGNHSSTLDVRLARADTVIFLDAPRRVCLYRVIKRSVLHRRRSRTDRAEGCNERLDRVFLRWVWTFPKEGKAQLLSAIETHAPHAKVVRLRTNADVDRFLSALGSG